MAQERTPVHVALPSLQHARVQCGGTRSHLLLGVVFPLHQMIFGGTVSLA